MAVVVNIDSNGTKEYKSAKNAVTISDEEIGQAEKLDKFIYGKLKKYVDKNKKESFPNGKLTYYWGLGRVIREIYFESELVEPEEKELFFENVRLRFDDIDENLPKNDLKRNRNIPKQFFKLAGYNLESASILNWSEWSYLFDNKYLMNYANFGNWFEDKINQPDLKLDESFIRLWVELFNSIFRNIDIEYIDETEFNKALNATILIVREVKNNSIFNISDRVERKRIKYSLKRSLEDKKKMFIKLQMGEINVDGYVTEILNEFQKIHKRKSKGRVT